MITGGCLCGRIRYRYSGEVEELAICHCSQCRKAQGTPFVTNIPARTDQFVVERGEEVMKAYHSSPDKKRVFCGNCGSPIFSQRTDMTDRIRLRAGTVDSDFIPREIYHIYRDSKAGWFDHEDDLASYGEGR